MFITPNYSLLHRKRDIAKPFSMNARNCVPSKPATSFRGEGFPRLKRFWSKFCKWL